MCGKCEMKLALASLLFSILFVAVAMKTLSGGGRDPFFVDTSLALSRYEPMLSANQTIGTMDDFVRKRMNFFDDSLSKILDSLSKGKLDERNLLELLNMESNVARHKMHDSARQVAGAKIQNVYEQFNSVVASFGQQHGFEILFGTASNFVVYGAKGKADKTRDLLRYMGVKDE